MRRLRPSPKSRLSKVARRFWVGVLPTRSEQEVANVPGKSPGPSVKKPKTYEALKKKGMSKSRAARISNAQAKKSR